MYNWANSKPVILLILLGVGWLSNLSFCVCLYVK